KRARPPDVLFELLVAGGDRHLHAEPHISGDRGLRAMDEGMKGILDCSVLAFNRERGDAAPAGVTRNTPVYPEVIFSKLCSYPSKHHVAGCAVYLCQEFCL